MQLCLMLNKFFFIFCDFIAMSCLKLYLVQEKHLKLIPTSSSLEKKFKMASYSSYSEGDILTSLCEVGRTDQQPHFPDGETEMQNGCQLPKFTCILSRQNKH